MHSICNTRNTPLSVWNLNACVMLNNSSFIIWLIAFKWLEDRPYVLVSVNQFFCSRGWVDCGDTRAFRLVSFYSIKHLICFYDVYYLYITVRVIQLQYIFKEWRIHMVGQWKFHWTVKWLPHEFSTTDFDCTRLCSWEIAHKNLYFL